MFEFTQNIPKTGYTFVIPSLSVGNVPQLAVDLLIESLKMKKIGFAFHPGIVPVIGPPAFAHEPQNTSSCEVFINDDKKIVALQLRAPVAAKLLQSFLDQVLSLLIESCPRQVVVLGSCFSHERRDPAVKLKMEYVGNKLFTDEYVNELAEFVQQPDNKLPWQGFATKMFDTFDGKLNIPLGVLYAYVSEGDNVPDARELCLCLDKILKSLDKTDVQSLAMPISWRLLFGNDGPPELFY